MSTDLRLGSAGVCWQSFLDEPDPEKIATPPTRPDSELAPITAYGCHRGLMVLANLLRR